MIFWPTLPPGNENLEQSSKPIQQSLYTYLSSGSAFSANLTPPNKQSFKVKSIIFHRNFH